jgi:hypothetical protein
MDYLAHSVTQWQVLIKGITNFLVPETAWEPEERSICRDEAKGWRVVGFNPDSFKIFISSPNVQTKMGPTQPPECVPGVKRPQRDAEHCPPSSVEVKNVAELLHQH